MSAVDRLISEFDRALRAVAGVARSTRASPAHPIEEAALDEAARAHAAALMRVNHVGEICAQALYQGQRSEEHTSELQSPCNLVCRLLLEKKKQTEKLLHLRTRRH